MKPIQAPRPLAEDAAERIRDEILSGRLTRGERLVEARIAGQLQVSRGPVREAFKLLRAEGLLQEEPRRGTYVVSLSPNDVRDLYDLRAAVEARAAKLVARSHTDADVALLGSKLDALAAAAVAGDLRAVSRADLEFHEAVARLSGNGRLLAAFQRSAPLLKTLIALDEHLYASLDDIADEHRAMLEAIERGDGDEASRRFERHIEHSGSLVAGHIDAL
jgi:GntR family transcriptional regulator, gluconate operon transcriptional repressor